MESLFDEEKKEIWYHPIADRLFIFHRATFFMLPCLERQDGCKLICANPKDTAPEIIFIGEL